MKKFRVNGVLVEEGAVLRLDQMNNLGASRQELLTPPMAIAHQEYWEQHRRVTVQANQGVVTSITDRYIKIVLKEDTGAYCEYIAPLTAVIPAQLRINDIIADYQLQQLNVLSAMLVTFDTLLRILEDLRRAEPRVDFNANDNDFNATVVRVTDKSLTCITKRHLLYEITVIAKS